MSPNKVMILSLPLILSFCLNGRLVESKQQQQRGLVVPEGSVVCLTEEQCRAKFDSMNLSGNFYTSSDYPTKGCYQKNEKVFFGSGGTVEDKSFTELPGVQQRLWCDAPTPEPTPNPTRLILATAEPTLDDDATSSSTDTPTAAELCIQESRVCFTDASCCSGECDANGRCTAPIITSAPTADPLSGVPCLEENLVCFSNASCCSGECNSNGRCTATVTPPTPAIDPMEEEETPKVDFIGTAPITDGGEEVEEDEDGDITIDETPIDEDEKDEPEFVLDLPSPSAKPTPAPVSHSHDDEQLNKDMEGEFIENKLDTSTSPEPVQDSKVSNQLAIMITVFSVGAILVALYAFKTRRAMREEMASAAAADDFDEEFDEESSAPAMPQYIDVVENKPEQPESLSSTLLRTLAAVPTAVFGGGEESTAQSETVYTKNTRVSGLTQPAEFNQDASVNSQQSQSTAQVSTVSENMDMFKPPLTPISEGDVPNSTFLGRTFGCENSLQDSRPSSGVTPGYLPDQYANSQGGDQTEKEASPWDTLCGAYGAEEPSLTAGGSEYSGSRPTPTTGSNYSSNYSGSVESTTVTEDECARTAQIKNTRK